MLPVACDSGLAVRRADLCRRAVSALVATDALPEIQRVGNGPGDDVVRVDFRLAGGPDKGKRPRWLLCRFEPGGDAFVAATTDEGPVSGASLYLLRHYYLDTPDGGAQPGASR